MISGIPISAQLLEQLKKKLNVGNLRSIQLNCVPGRLSTRLDLFDLSHIEEEVPNNFLEHLLTSKKCSFKITFDNLNLNFASETNNKEKELGLISKRLNNLVNYNKEDYQEYGYETFGFGFPVVSFSPQEAPDKVIKAPLFIWHLSIKKDITKTNTWVVSRTKDHEIEFNNLLRSYVNQSNGIAIDDFNEHELSDGYLDKDLLFSKTIDFIKQFSSSNIEKLNHSLSEMSDTGISEMPSREKFENLANSIPKVYWSGVFGRFTQRNEAIRQEMNNEMYDLISNGVETDQELIHELMHSETAALTDPSQEGILNHLKKNKHLIIQGPPGTGKSESITGIIINALEHGNKCLVVCEKKTAMDILKRNLTDISSEIGELVGVVEDVSRDRKNIVNSVRDRYELIGSHDYPAPGSINLSDQLNKIEEYISTIQNRKKYLQEDSVVEAMETKGLGGAVGEELKARFNNCDERVLEKFREERITESEFNFNDVKDFLEKFEQDTESLNYQTPLCFLSNDIIQKYPPLDLKDKLESLSLENVESLSTFLERFTLELQVKKTEVIKKVEVIISEIGKDIQAYGSLLEDIADVTLFKKAGFKLKLLKLVSKLNDKLLYQIEQFEKIPDIQNRLLDNFRKLNFEPEIFNVHSIEAYDRNHSIFSEDLSKLQKDKGGIAATFYENLIQTSFCEIRLDNSFLEELSGWKSESSGLIVEFYTGEYDSERTSDIIGLLRWVETSSRNIKAAIDEGFLDHFDWQHTLYKQPNDLQKIVLTLTEAKAKNWTSYFTEFYFHGTIRKKLDHSLSKNFESELKLLEDERDRIVNEIKKRIPKVWKAKQSKSTNVNIPQLYNKRGSRGRRRNSLRKIANRSFESLTNYFPVMMVSPNVCASLFKLEPDLFDYVIFDEASQLKIEESLSTLIRGKRKVISGDSKQMPPSYWFTKQGDVLDDDNQDEDDYDLTWEENLMNTEGASDLANSESLLHFAEICGFKSFHLDFHYRSHHPLLVEFSNAAFYKNRLHPLPERIDDVPIQFIPVNSVYEKQSNVGEATVAVEILKKIETKENGVLPSVGIATFNQKQKKLILETIKKETQIDKDFRAKYRELEDNGLFVKNLENIQGDEREVLILSTTYGKDSSGRFVRKYGPVATKGLGKRLLNVIVTRAKLKIYLLSSVPEEIYTDFKNELGGSNELERGYFHAYLAYGKAVSDKNVKEIDSILKFLSSRSNTLSPTINLTDSPFEESVYQGLIEYVDKERVTLQYKAGGFRIDIAIKSMITGKERIAIECDGATYHGTPEDYAWDSYRQSILEEHGFIFHRIWSRDFWENADREIHKLVNFIKEQDEIEKSASESQESITSETDEFVTDLLKDSNIRKADSEIPKSDNEEKSKEPKKPKRNLDQTSPKRSKSKSKRKRVESEKIDQLALEYDSSNKTKVDIGQVILIQDLESDKEMKIKFIKGASGSKTENGVTVLGDKSPIGESMMGRIEGETIELNNLERYYKIISVGV